jgi:cytochrome c oxidase cbb3-type subunit 3/ubiquinol-cytochrome c reductase cytochrome c subunit
VYLAVAGEGTLRTITAKGVPGSLMPAFAKSAGGMLTDQQVEVLVHGMLQQQGIAEMLSVPGLPSYSAASAGDAARGFEAFGAHCARCHGASGEGSGGDAKNGTRRIGSIVNGSYLALISDQGLRSIVISGRPGEGMPDWRSDGAQPLTEPQITDIVAWLASKRIADPGQPYAAKP